MANQEQNPLQQEQPFVAAKQVGFNLEDIILNTNNKVSILYPEHTNKETFKCVSDFISKCCLREPFTRSPNMYKEYLAKFSYSAKALENSKVSFSIPTGGIYGEVSVNTFRNTIGAHYLPHSSEYVAPPSIDIVRLWFETIRYREIVPAKWTLKKSLLPPKWRLLMAHIIQCLGGKTGGFEQISNKDAIILYSIANGINIDYAIKLNKKHREKFVPYAQFLCLLMMHKMKEGYVDAKIVVFKAPKPSSNAERVSQGTKPGAQPGHKKHSTSSKQHFVSSREATKGGQTSASTHVVTEIHKEDQQGTGGPNSLGVTSEERADPQLSSGYDASENSTAEADPGKSAPNLESPKDDPIIVVDDSYKDEEADKDGLHATSNIETKDASHKLELEKNKSEAALLKAQPSFPNVVQLNELLVKSLQTEFLKILYAHDFSSSLPTELKELSSKFNELTEVVKGLKKQVHELEIELPGDLKEISTKLEDFTKTITSLTSQVAELKTLEWELPAEFLSVPTQVETVQAKLKTLDALPSLLNKVTNALDQFAQAIALKKTEDASVPSVSQAGTQPAEGEKNINQTTIS
ncbi:hypothetical protein Tco_0325200 [Tanacetum coccineum]